MIYIKKPEEIAAIRAGGKILNKILQRLLEEAVPGKNTEDIEKLALSLIKEAGGSPAFLNYPMGGGIYFPSAVCVSINDEVVHGSALPNRVIKSGDIVDLDIGMEWPIRQEDRDRLGFPTNPHSEHGGYFTDMCKTKGVGKVNGEAKKLMRVTREALDAGISQAKPGNYLNDIANAIENVVNKHGYGIVRDLVGHGVGYLPHEEPDVFNYKIADSSGENIKLKEGMVIAIEPMINLGTYRVKVADNDYTILTEDGSFSAHFEHTVAITKNGPEILTSR